MTDDLGHQGQAAYRDLAAHEPVFARLIDRTGGRRRSTGTTVAAPVPAGSPRWCCTSSVSRSPRRWRSRYDRLTAAVDGVPTPDGVLAAGAERLRACGLSAAKVGYLLALAASQVSDAFDIERLDGTPDTAVLATLTALPGIGVWTAETFLLHNLRRPDVLPAADLGIRRAVQRQWALDDLPAVPDVRDRGAPWAPHRSYAAAVLWRSLSPPGQPADPKQRALVPPTGRTA